jgi:predicted helicase
MDGIIVNETLTLLGIEPAALKYRLGTRSAIEWVIDQYVGESSVEHDEDVVRLIGQVLAVSEQTVALIQGLPAAFTS